MSTAFDAPPAVSNCTLLVVVVDLVVVAVVVVIVVVVVVVVIHLISQLNLSLIHISEPTRPY